MYESDLNSLENRVHELEKKNRYLKSLLDKAGIHTLKERLLHTREDGHASSISYTVEVRA
ncbi:MAG: hypothetical protein PUG68_06695 [Lachnospiraceae bacterium]|nr:hypothetical protein [Lachnospiraceae bacterium]MDD7327470.1 hypothetical protein [Lachnospiraceae bacterium]MDY2759692.1 hypothetical protein [Lachnospiraceae bacterium]